MIMLQNEEVARLRREDELRAAERERLIRAVRAAQKDRVRRGPSRARRALAVVGRGLIALGTSLQTETPDGCREATAS